MARLSDFHPDNLGPVDEDPYRDRSQERVEGEALDLREQMQEAIREAAAQHIGMPMNQRTRDQLSATVSTAIMDNMNLTDQSVVGTVPGSTPMTSRTLESGQPMMHSVNMEMTVVNTNGVAKDERGNPLFCYGCAGSAADASFPSFAVEWRCSNCIRCMNEEMTSLEKKGQKTYDKYINAEYTEILSQDIRDAYKEELKKEVIEELNTDKTILTGQKLKRIIKNG